MREPEWDEQSRAAVIALDVYEASLCPLCGQPREVCQDAANSFNWRTPPPVRCHATSARLAQQARFSEESNPQVGALLFGVELVESGVPGG